MDNRHEWDGFYPARIGQTVSTCPAAPGPYEETLRRRLVEQIIRPTGLVDPLVVVEADTGTIDDLLEQVRLRVERDDAS